MCVLYRLVYSMQVYMYNNRMVGKEKRKEREGGRRERMWRTICIVHVCSTYIIDPCVCIYAVLIQRAGGMHNNVAVTGRKRTLFRF